MEDKPDYGVIYEFEGKQKRINESNAKTIGWLAGFMLLFFGFLISLTGIGAVVGIPLMIAGVVIPFTSRNPKYTLYKVICPTCGYEVTTTKKPGLTCKACKKRMVLQGDRYVKVD